MGCSPASKKNLMIFNNKYKRNEILSKEEIIYTTNHEKFESLLLEPKIKEEFESTSNINNFNTFIDTFFIKWKAQLDKLKLTKQDIIEISYEKGAESLIIDYLKYKDWDVIDTVTNLIENLKNMSDKNFEIVEDLILTSTRYIPAKQKGCIFPDSNLEMLKLKSIKGIFNTLKFNTNFKLQIFTLFLYPDVFANLNYMIDLSDIIITNENLKTLIVIIANNNLKDLNIISDVKHLNTIKFILESAILNASVETLIFGNYDNYNFKLPQETVQAFLELVKADKLIALCITKIQMKNEEIDILLNLIGNLSKLKFLIFDIKLDSGQVDKLKDILKKNNVLVGVLLGNADIQDIQGLCDDIAKGNPGLKFLHYEEKINYFI
jgi:hypothetical protein